MSDADALQIALRLKAPADPVRVKTVSYLFSSSAGEEISRNLATALDLFEPAGPDSDRSDDEVADHRFPAWFHEFLDERQIRKPSKHTMKACRQDFDQIVSLLNEGDPAELALTDITRDTARAAFARYARNH